MKAPVKLKFTKAETLRFIAEWYGFCFVGQFTGLPRSRERISPPPRTALEVLRFSIETLDILVYIMIK